MRQPTFFLVCLAILAAVIQVDAEPDNNIVSQNSERELQNRIFDRLFPEDICENSPGNYGICDQTRFPQCREGTLICYNRKPMRDKFYKDTRQPYFYIDYDNVFCYPDKWSGCSSCAPGRYCLSENRCVLDDVGYPCAQWF